ncbi:MAG: signal recognition particle-docking protein FtsY [Micrococcales bacterium]|nr:signal recognition particle-docking protein FtsY [Micrococcales bacterium]
MTTTVYVLLGILVLVAAVTVALVLVRRSRAKSALPPDAAARVEAESPPEAVAEAEAPADKDKGPPAVPPTAVVEEPEVPQVDESAPDWALVEEEEPEPAGPDLEQPEAPASRIQRLRARLAGSGKLGQVLLSVLSRGQLSEDDWDEFEEALLMADVGAEAAEQILGGVRQRLKVAGTGGDARQALRAELLQAVQIDAPRDICDLGEGGNPGVVLVVGVNGSGKTTTIGRLARLEVAQGRTAVLGAADTFRAAAAEQLTTWGERVGVETVRGPEGGDPASVAFDAVARGIKAQVDTVIVDTAGRLHNKANLMAELSKIAKVTAKQAPITETLLVLDATTGQNGLVQAQVFTEAVEITGIVLTKLDGTAKGGIVISVQRQLGVPVKLVGLGEGPDDIAPFDPEAFVDAIVA